MNLISVSDIQPAIVVCGGIGKVANVLNPSSAAMNEMICNLCVCFLGRAAAFPTFWQIPELTCSPTVGSRSLMSPTTTRASTTALYRTAICLSVQS